MPDKIRVLFAIGSMGGGGSERQLLGILRYLDRSTFSPLLYLIYRNGEFIEDIPKDVPVFAFWERHSKPGLNYPGRIFRMQCRDLAKVIQEQEANVLYARTFSMALIAHGGVRHTGVPWVGVEAADPKLGLEENTDRFVRFKHWMLGRAYRSASRVLTVSEGVRRSMLDYYGLPPEQVTTIYNFMDLDRIDRLAAEGTPRLDDDRFHIVCAGRLHPQKGYRYLLEAIEELVHRRGLKRLLLHLIGQGPQESELKKLTAETGLEEHVVFEGFLQNPYTFFKACQLFCLPSLYEGMPNTLLEAMACRIPVLAADCPSGPREILRDDEHGLLVPPADSKALADAIWNATENYEDWQARVEPARQYIEDEFSPKVGIKRLQDLLLEVRG